MAHPVMFQWLRKEPEILDHIGEFLSGRQPDILEVYGPPTTEDVERMKRRRDHKVYFPGVTLRFFKTLDLFAGKVYVKVAASPDHLERIASWVLTQAHPIRRQLRTPQEALR